MTKRIIMPKATAIWLVDNTSLTFKQIANFCDMHELEIHGIADGQVAKGVSAFNPVAAGQLSKEEIKRCQEDQNASLQLSPDPSKGIKIKGRRSKYIPVAKRQDKPDAILWIVKNYPDVKDKEIARLIGTTSSMITLIRDKTHWNIKNIRPRDPVVLGLCSQREFDELIKNTQPTVHQGQ